MIVINQSFFLYIRNFQEASNPVNVTNTATNNNSKKSIKKKKIDSEPKIKESVEIPIHEKKDDLDLTKSNVNNAIIAEDIFDFGSDDDSETDDTPEAEAEGGEAVSIDSCVGNTKSQDNSCQARAS